MGCASMDTGQLGGSTAVSPCLDQPRQVNDQQNHECQLSLIPSPPSTLNVGYWVRRPDLEGAEIVPDMEETYLGAEPWNRSKLNF